MEHDSRSFPIPPHRPKRRTPWQTVSARVISIVSRKGGVGKTTSAINLGAAFALSGHTVLVVGVDPQCGVATTLGHGRDDLDGGLLDLFEKDLALTHLAHTTPVKNLYFVSANVGDPDVEERYLDLMDRNIDGFVAQIDRARNLYDTILIDCPPSLSAPTRAALLASDSFLVPAQAEELCRDSLAPLIASLDAFRDKAFGPPILPEAEESERPLDMEGIFLTMVSSRTRACREVSARVCEEFGPVLLSAAIPRTTRLAEMALRGKPAVIYDRRSAGSRAYFDLADELMTRYCEREGLPAPEPAVGADQRDEAAAGFPGDAAERSAPSAAAAGRESPAAGSSRPATGAGPAFSGLDRLLNDLKAHGSLQQPVAPAPDDMQAPEMVSLDDLLREEEQQEDSDPSWSYEGRRHNRLN